MTTKKTDAGAEDAATKKSGGTLAVIDAFEMPEISEEFKEVLMEEMSENDDITMSFPVLKVPSGGNLAFTLPGEDGDVAKTLDVVIVDRFKANAYWENVFDGNNNPPDCMSPDAEFGYGYPGGECASCSLNQFGSDPKDGKGKACKNMVRTYILLEGEMLPWKLDIPPTSLRVFSDYISSVVLKGKHPYGVVTRIGLETAKNTTGITYSKLTFKAVGALTKEQTAASKEYVSSIKLLTRDSSPALKHAVAGGTAPQQLEAGDAPDQSPDEELF